MKTQKQVLGQIGEETAANFLKEKGYLILGRNWHCPFGELDIIAAKTSGKIFKKTEAIVFVEVKTINQAEALFEAQAEQNVNFFKQKRLIKSAHSFLKTKHIKPEIPWQIDVVAIEFNIADGSSKIRHHENAVWSR
ncbi:MAG: YraN family protein [Candidatus Portnoybacteria bacterium]|nr:YraN family protein [Candidatus Portnoybacteria bacterium]